MKQKKKYFVLLFSILVLNMVYMIDRNQITKIIESYKKDIRIIDEELKTGSNIMDEVNILRKNFVDNIDQLKDYKISASELINELSRNLLIRNEVSMTCVIAVKSDVKEAHIFYTL